MDETERHRRLATYAENDTYEKVRRLVDFESGQKLRILDAGCGRGILDEHLRWLGHEVVGLDINSDIPYDGMKNIQCDISRDWPIADGSFDLVLATDVPEHMYDPAHILTQGERVLKPAGRIIFGVPNHFDVRQRLRILAGRGIVHWDHVRYGSTSWDYPHIRFFTIRELEAGLRERGWKIVRRQYNFMGCGIVPSFCKPLNRMLLRLSPGLFSGKFIVLLGREDGAAREGDIFVEKTYPGM